MIIYLTISKNFKQDALKYIDEHPGVAIREVAKMLGVPKDTLYGWTKDWESEHAGLNLIQLHPLTKTSPANSRIFYPETSLRNSQMPYGVRISHIYLRNRVSCTCHVY